MRKLLCTLAMLVAAMTVSAQVSYLEMIEARNAAAPDYISPATLTPAVSVTDKESELFMKFIKNK